MKPEEELIQRTDPNEQEEGTEPDYLDAIKKLKENSVDREKYNKLAAENRRLLDEVVNGRTGQDDSVKKEAPDVTELRQKLFGGNQDLSNLEYVETALQLRNALKESDGIDIFAGHGVKYNPSTEDLAAAERVATVFQECVDYAQGDSEVFTNELMRRTNDTGPRFNFQRR